VSIPKEEAATKSAAAFKFVFENGPKIELDHHIVYYARELFSLFVKGVLNWNTDYEYGRLLRCQGKTDEAREQFELVLSGKTLEVGPSGRKGKYSMEVGPCSLSSSSAGCSRRMPQNALHIRSHAALEDLNKRSQKMG